MADRTGRPFSNEKLRRSVYAKRSLGPGAERMGNVRIAVLLACFAGLGGCVACPDPAPGVAVAPACRFTPEQEELHRQMARDRQERDMEMWQRGSGM
jgi:hypothetical protein